MGKAQAIHDGFAPMPCHEQGSKAEHHPQKSCGCDCQHMVKLSVLSDNKLVHLSVNRRENMAIDRAYYRLTPESLLQPPKSLS